MPREDSYTVSQSQKSLTSLTSRAAEEMYIAHTHPSTATDGGPPVLEMVLQPTSSEPMEYDRNIIRSGSASRGDQYVAARDLILERAASSKVTISDLPYAMNQSVIVDHDVDNSNEGHHPEPLDTTNLVGISAELTAEAENERNDEEEEEEDEDINQLQPPSSARYSPMGFDDEHMDHGYDRITDGYRANRLSPSPQYRSLRSRTATPQADPEEHHKGFGTNRRMGGIQEENYEDMYGRGQYSVSPGIDDDNPSGSQSQRGDTPKGRNGNNRSIASIYHNPQEVRSPSNAYQWIEKTLRECDPDMWHVYLDNFKRNKVSDDTLKFLKDSDWKELIPVIGTRRLVMSKCDMM